MIRQLIRDAVMACMLASATSTHPVPAQQADAADSDCRANSGLNFICGVTKPEDLAALGDTQWLIASGFEDGAGLKLVDMSRNSMRLWYLGTPDQIAPTSTLCPRAPDVRHFKTRGLGLRRITANHYELLVVAHKSGNFGREAIERFDVDTRGSVPQLTWRDCLPMPEEQQGNAVAGFADGTVLATVLTRTGTTITDFVLGRNTGAVYAWSPGASQFKLLPGTELPGNNGLEVDPDQKHFYVVAFGRHSVVEYDRSDTRTAVGEFVTADFMPDNIHWTQGLLVAAGMRLDEPACGGRRRVIDGVADSMACHRGYVAAALDTRKGEFDTLAYAEPDEAFSGVSTAIFASGRLWLGSFQADRLAWRSLAVPFH